MYEIEIENENEFELEFARKRRFPVRSSHHITSHPI